MKASGDHRCRKPRPEKPKAEPVTLDVMLQQLANDPDAGPWRQWAKRILAGNDTPTPQPAPDKTT